MSLYKQFETNAAVETAGILLQYGKTEDGRPINIRIRRAGGANKQYTKLMEVRVKPHRRQILNETIDRSLTDDLVKDVFAETVVIGWENVEDRAGKAIEFNKANVLKLFDDLPDLYADIQEQANRASLFRMDIRENDSKNS